jgi:hypothetical protein
MKLVRYVAHMGDWRGIFRDFVGKHKASRTLARPRHRWKYTINPLKKKHICFI